MFARASLASFALLITVAACSSDSNSGTPADAAKQTDAAASTNTVMTVTCPASVALTVATDDTPPYGAYTLTPKSNMISVGDVVHFMLPSIHNVAPKPGSPSDPGLTVGFGGDACLKFTKAGTFTFYCSSHAFSASIVVQ